MTRYTLVFLDKVIPTVEIRGKSRVVKRTHGLTRQAAFLRAMRWAGEHGDPRFK